jgi:hypothetical protein
MRKGYYLRQGRSKPLEVRMKISASLKGRKCSPESIAKRITKLRGHAVSAEARVRIGAANKGHKYNLGRHHSPESIAKMKVAKMGHQVSPETRAKISATKRRNAEVYA